MLSLPFLQPLHLQPIPSFYSEALALLLGLIGAVILFSSSSRCRDISIPHVLGLPLLLLGPVILQWGLGYFAYTSSALMLALFLCWLAIIMISVRSLMTILGETVLLIRLAWFVSIGSVLNALIGVLQFFDLTGAFVPLLNVTVNGAGVYGNLAQENHFATHLAIGLSALIYLRAVVRLRWFLFMPLVAILAGGIFLSGSRSGLIFLGLIITLLAYTSYLGIDSSSIEKKRARNQIILWIGCMTLVLLLVLILTLFFAEEFPQFQRYLHYSETIGARLYLWKNAVDMFFSAPLLGVGFDSFGFQLVEQLGKNNQLQHWGIDQYAHNIVFQLLAVSGLTGLLALLIPVGLFVHQQWAIPGTPARYWSWTVLVILLLHSLLEQPLYYAYFVACAGVFLACSEQHTWEHHISSRTRVLILSILACGIFANLKTVADFAILETNFFEPKTERNGADYQPERQDLILSLHKFSLFTPILEAISPESFVPHEAPIREKLALNLRLMHYSPTAEVEYRHVVLLAQDGQKNAAQERFRIAMIAYPAHAQMVLQRIKTMAQSEPETYQALAEFADTYLSAAPKLVQP